VGNTLPFDDVWLASWRYACCQVLTAPAVGPVLGLATGRGEIPTFADDGDACGRRPLLGGAVMAAVAYPIMSAGGNPWSGLSDPAAAASRCRSLLGGAVKVAHGVPLVAVRRWWQLLRAWTSEALCTSLSSFPGQSCAPVSSGPANHSSTLSRR
jgi:hypothetical protein